MEHETLALVHNWSSTNMGVRILRRTVCQERRVIIDHLIKYEDDHYEHYEIEVANNTA